jgi:RimJ/RimL family protein N-acetyltransferase
MIPVVLRTERLVLDQPAAADVPLMTKYCSDPVFEHTMATPWPYEERHAVGFITQVVPAGWANGSEFTWAIRKPPEAPLLGVVGFRTTRGDLGFWMGAPHRGRGYTPEAVHAVLDFVFGSGTERVRWECRAGNTASAAVARKCGFRFTGEGPADVLGRDGSRPPSWHGELTADDDRTEKDGWPA